MGVGVKYERNMCYKNEADRINSLAAKVTVITLPVCSSSTWRWGCWLKQTQRLPCVPVTGNYPVHYVDVFVLTVLNTLSVTECAGLSLRSVTAAFWETLREWECWETLRKVSFEPDVLPKSFLLLIVKQDKHSMSMRRYTKSQDNHVI